MSQQPPPRVPVPRDRNDDYTEAAAQSRRDFLLQQRPGSRIDHIGHYSLPPSSLRGNVELFAGVAQVPIGIAGPLRINGEHAQGDFYVPMATTEGTLVASYNRGMRLIAECGGVRTTVVEQHMQRSPVFFFSDARASRDFGHWIEDHLDGIRAAAEATTRFGKLIEVLQFAVATCVTCASTITPAMPPVRTWPARRRWRLASGYAIRIRIIRASCCRATSTPTRSTRS